MQQNAGRGLGTPLAEPHSLRQSPCGHCSSGSYWQGSLLESGASLLRVQAHFFLTIL